MFDAGKTRMVGLPYGEKTMTFSSDTGTSRTDGQTDGQNCYINIVIKFAYRPNLPGLVQER